MRSSDTLQSREERLSHLSHNDLAKANAPDNGNEAKLASAVSRRLAQLAEESSTKGTDGQKALKIASNHHSGKVLKDNANQGQKLLSETNLKLKCGLDKSDACDFEKRRIADKVIINVEPTSAAIRAGKTTPILSISAGARLASARVRSAQYVSANKVTAKAETSLAPSEREAYRARFKLSIGQGAFSSPGNGDISEEFRVRAIGDSGGGSSDIITCLASLANERIDAAIAAGSFQKIPRGTKARPERDYNSCSPFIDTTEYLMNRIVKRQDIVPAWIEKQQEILTCATRFRARLRADWRRHAARIIASEGGSLGEQMNRARLYALAELQMNPQSGQKKEQDKREEDIVSTSKFCLDLPRNHIADTNVSTTQELHDDFVNVTSLDNLVTKVWQQKSRVRQKLRKIYSSQKGCNSQYHVFSETQAGKLPKNLTYPYD